MKKYKMKKSNRSNQNVLLLAISLVVAVVIAGCGWFLVVKEIENHKQKDILSYGNQQTQLVNQIVKNATELLNGKPNSERAVVEQIIKQAETNGSRFWMFGTQDKILFLKNEAETQNYAKSSFLELAQEYADNGGVGAIELQNRLQQKQNGLFLYSKSKNDKQYLMSLQFFEANGETYVIALSTAQEYIISSLGLTFHTVHILLFAGVALLILVLLVLIYTLIITNYKKQIINLNKQLVEKNTLIASLSKNQASKTDDEKSNIYDELTGILYNRSFAEAILRKMNHEKLYPIGVSVFRMSDKGYCEDTALFRTANILRKYCNHNDILARDGNDFILITTKQTQQEVEKRIATIQEEYLQEGIKETMQVALAIKNDVGHDSYDMLEQAYQEVEQKLEIEREENFLAIQSI